MHKPKYLIGFILTMVFRLFRVFPNADPIMGFVVPAAKREPIWKSALFAFSAILLFDVITNAVGIWTVVTSLTYGAVAVMISIIIRNRKATLPKYIGVGALGVIVFDVITGPLMSTFIFDMPLWASTLGQIPFTVMHLISVVFMVTIIAPFVDLDIRKEVFGYMSSVSDILLRRVKV